MEQSLFQKLKEYNTTMLPMHMPGHKRNLALSGTDGYLAALGADCDITEIAGFDNLAEPEEILLSLKEKRRGLPVGKRQYLWNFGGNLCHGTQRRNRNYGTKLS